MHGMAGDEQQHLPEGDLGAENVRLRQLLVQAGLDASMQQVADQFQRLLMEELHHRVQNTLATVMAITTQSLKSAQSLRQADEAIGVRLRALGRAHDLLMRVSWSSAKLKEVVATAIEAFGSDRFRVSLPDVHVSASTVLPIAMVLNELCTNAVKYGAFTNPTGRVEILGTAVPDAHLCKIVWTERGGPTVSEPTHRSFGTQLIERSFNQTLGNPHMRFEPAGLVCAFDVPISMSDQTAN